MKGIKSRNMLIDAARLVCTFLVIVIHTRLWSDADFYVGHFLSNVVGRMAVPLFFMFAGYFLYTRLEREAHPVDYLKKYLLNLCRVYLVWSLIYLPYDFHKLLQSGDSYAEASGGYLHRFFIEGGHFHLWFFPALIYAVLIVGIFYIEGKAKLLGPAAVLLYMIGLAGEPYRGWFTSMPAFADLFGLVYELGTSRSALFFALPFVVWGLGEHKALKKVGNRVLGVVFLLALSALTWESFSLEEKFRLGGFNLYLFLMPTTYLAFVLLIKSSITLPRISLRTLRDLSLLVYCLHGIFLILIDDYLPHTIHSFDRFLLCSLSTLAFSLLILKSDRLRKVLL